MIVFLDDDTIQKLTPMQSMTGKWLVAVLVTLEDIKPEPRSRLTEIVFTRLIK